MTLIEKIKQLRAETNLSLDLCRQALEKSQGEMEKAKIFLKQQGYKILLDKAASTPSDSIKQGIIHAYIHSNKKIGVLLDLRCLTDFTAKSEAFQKLAHDLSLQIAATNPLYIKAEDVPTEVLQREKEIYRNQVVTQNKPEKIVTAIVEGKIKKYFEEVCLLSQPFIKDPNKKVEDIIKENIAQAKENIIINSFARYQI
jgi:elongation factor Ts